jgi:hypothetical protein
MLVNNLGIIWPNKNILTSNVLNRLKQLSNVTYECELKLENLSQLIFDVYSFDKGLKVFKAENILAKLERLKAQGHTKVTFVEFNNETFKDTVKSRNQIREEFNAMTSSPAFDIFHCASNINEYNHLYNIIFSKATLQSYSIRPQMTSNLISRLTDLKKWARDTNTPLSDICVVGGAVLDLYGYKLCDDIDIVIKQSIRDERNYGSSPKLLTDGIDIVKSNYSRKKKIGKWFTDDELIYKPNLFVQACGIKFASLTIVNFRKQYSARPKDLADIEKIQFNMQLSNVHKIDPIDLLFDDRLDIICKYMFFKDLQNSTQDSKIEDMYRDHIFRRTKGKGDNKNSIDDYVSAAKSLFDSMKTNGFNSLYPVPYTSKGIQNGAHRIACALALGIKQIDAVQITHNAKHLPWSESFFNAKDIRYLNEAKIKLKTVQT